MRRSSDHHQGVVATPRELARRLVADLEAAGGPPRAVLDPACGEGALLEAAAEHFGSGVALFGIEPDEAAARAARERLPGATIRVADALDPSVEWPRGSHIAANPPWVSFSGRHRGPAAASSSDEALGGWPSLHGAFLSRIARHVSEEKTGARVLVPATILEGRRYGRLRDELEERVHGAAPAEDLEEDAFAGVTEPAVLLSLAPGAGALEPARVDGLEPLHDGARYPRLPARSFADPGVHTGNSAKRLVREAPADGFAPVRRGRDLEAFRLSPATQFLRTDLEPGGEARFRRKSLEHYASFPVLLRQTADRPVAALHEPRGYFRNSLLACRAVEGLDPAFVVAVLNSSVVRAWHRARHRDARQRTFPQVKVGHLDGIPFPLAQRSDDEDLHDRVARESRALHGLDAPGEQRERAAALDALDELVTGAYGLDASTARVVRRWAER